jgi:predicted ATPase
MGIHTGEADVRDGDYYGAALNRAARLMGAAHGGQVLVSLPTAEVLIESLPPGVELVDVGEHRLRDLSRPQRIFQVLAPGLVTEFSPIRSLDAYPGNLPAQLTSFIGRHEEVIGIAAALADSRLVTITGVGGVGKTRLALQAAAEVLPRFADGAWLCELAGAVDPDTMVQLVASTLAIRPRAGMSIEESVLDFLRSKRLLLVLDNCEHLLRRTARFAESALQECGEVAVLATSREGLGVRGEQVWPLRSLGVPDEATLDTVTGSEAVQLFTERAKSVRPDFSVTEVNAAAVAEVCQRLDGIPLAIELAAARVMALTPSDIAARLDERFRLLTGGRHTAVERHQTLRGAIDWSFSLLTEVEQSLFTRLGVFAGTFDAAAAESVASGGGVEPGEVIGVLAELVRKSMVVAEESGEQTMRYQLLETLRQYALERLEEAGDVDVWRRRHAEHYADWAETAARAMRGPDELRWRERVDYELDNLRAAMIWGLDASDVDAELALRIVSALAYETSFNRGAGVGAWAERAFARAERSESPARRTDVLGAAAYSALARGDHELARRRAEAAVVDGVSAEGWAPELAYVTLGYSAIVTGRHEDVARIMDEGKATLEASGSDEWNVVAISWTRAAFGALLGRSGMREAAEEVTRAARLLGNPTAIANSVHALALALAREEPDRALAYFEESIALMRLGNDNLLDSALGMIAHLRARRGDREGALTALHEATEHNERTGDRPQMVATVGWGISILARFGDPEAAAVLAGGLIDGPLAPLNKFPGTRRSHGDQPLAQLEAALGESEYRAAAARGAGMSNQELHQFMRAEIDRLLLVEADA